MDASNNLAETANLTFDGTNFGVGGYTALGTGAPSIKMKKLTGTTASTEGGSVNVAHGLTRTKILDVSVLVDTGSFTISPAYLTIAGYLFDVLTTSTNIAVANDATNSENILSKAFTVLITYEE